MSALSARERDRVAMLEVLQGLQVTGEQTAAMMLDAVTKALGSALDPSDTDEGGEQVQTALNSHVLDAVIYVARQRSWSSRRTPAYTSR